MQKSTTAQNDKLAELLSSVTTKDIEAISRQLLSIGDRKQHFTQLCRDDVKFWTDFSQELGNREDVEFEDAMFGAVLAISVLSRRSKIEHLSEYFSQQPAMESQPKQLDPQAS